MASVCNKVARSKWKHGCHIVDLFECLLIYSDKLAHVKVVINCRYSVAQMCRPEDMLAHYLAAPFIDDVMRDNTLLTQRTYGKAS